uniref:Olfactory receptor n=1 Tax=Rhinolophus ferrumequinum TaxID=59479 RepID=A0A671EFF0_RHIFE
MEGDNGTVVTEFVLLGFSGFGSFRGPLFWGVLCIYLVTLLGNSLIIPLTLVDPALHSPMYFFLRHFSMVETLYTTTIVPRMLADLLSSCPTIPSAICFTQLYFFVLFGITECCLLTAMAYDRYAAICRPLHYTTLMNRGACASMVGTSYLMGIIAGTTHSIFIFTLPFHGANTIHHFLCDILPVLRLASANTFWGEQMVIVCSVLIFIMTLVCVVLSYMYIIRTILRFPSAQQRTKAFSTCSSHIIVVSITYGSCIFVYIKPSAKDEMAINKGVTILTTSISPMLNPFIYTLRNKQVKQAFKNLVKRIILLSKS